MYHRETGVIWFICAAIIIPLNISVLWWPVEPNTFMFMFEMFLNMLLYMSDDEEHLVFSNAYKDWTLYVVRF